MDRLSDGKTQLSAALQPLVLAAERALALDEGKRARTGVRTSGPLICERRNEPLAKRNGGMGEWEWNQRVPRTPIDNAVLWPY